MSASASAHEKIGPTAHVTAYAWHRLGMPYGQLFATRKGATLYWTFNLSVGWIAPRLKAPELLGYLEFRHRMIEAQLDLLAPDRIVELGAGLSRRGVTWVLDRNVPYTEIDLPHMTKVKREMLESGPGRVRRAVREGELELRSTDIFAPGFVDELAGLVRGFERPVVISEGMLDYFDLDGRELVLRHIARAFREAGVSGTYITDLQRADRERKYGVAPAVLRQAIQLATRGNGAQRPFRDHEHVDRFFKLAGFDEGRELKPKELADREPRLRRLISPTTVWLAKVEARPAQAV